MAVPIQAKIQTSKQTVQMSSVQVSRESRSRAVPSVGMAELEARQGRAP